MAPRLAPVLDKTPLSFSRVLGQFGKLGRKLNETFKLTDSQKGLLGKGALHLLGAVATKSHGQSVGSALKEGALAFGKEHKDAFLNPADTHTRKGIFELNAGHKSDLGRFAKGAGAIALNKLGDTKHANKLREHPNSLVRQGVAHAERHLGNYFNAPAGLDSRTHMLTPGAVVGGIYNAVPVY